MAVDRSYARLGLFLVVTVVLLFATALFFILRMKERPVIDLVTYSEGNVSGLEISSSVRFRGVEIGRVEDLRVEPRGSLIEIDFEVFIDRLTSIGADVELVRREAATGLFDRFRAQVVSNPVTGAAYLLIDMPQPPPLPKSLSFTPKRAYVPAMPTMMAKIEDRLPMLLERAEATLGTLGEIITRIPDSLDRSNRFFTNVERIFQESELPALSADSRKFFSTTSTQIEGIVTSLDGMVGKGGTLVAFAEEARAAIAAADLPASNRATREAMDQTSLAADDLRRSLPAMRESLEELRALARQLQDQPESVVFGQRQAEGKAK